MRAEGEGQAGNSELCAGDTWRLLGGSKTLGPGHWQPLLCDFAPLGLGRTDLAFFPKSSLLPYGRVFSWAGTRVKPRGKQPSGPAGALGGSCSSATSQAAEAAPIRPRSADCPRTSGWLPLPGEIGGSSTCSVSLHLAAFLMATSACRPWSKRPERIKRTRLSKAVAGGGRGCSPWPTRHL